MTWDLMIVASFFPSLICRLVPAAAAGVPVVPGLGAAAGAAGGLRPLLPGALPRLLPGLRPLLRRRAGRAHGGHELPGSLPRRAVRVLL